MRHLRTPRRTLGVALLAFALLSASCDGGDDGEAIGGGDQSPSTVIESTTAAPSETTTTAAPTPEEEVLAAYLGYWAAVDQAFGPPEANPEAPALRQYATGEVLPGIVTSAEKLKAEGSVARLLPDGQYVHQAEVVSLDGETATVRDCNIDDLVLEDASTGEIIDDGISTRLYVSTLVREDGQWKVAVLNQEMKWEGVAGCAVE